MIAKVVIYIHGKGGSADEAEHYRNLFPDCEVIGFDYQAQKPWEARDEFPAFFDAACIGCKTMTLIANSIGAFFAMHALADRKIDYAFFISPIIDMEHIIADIMKRANVTEGELCELKEIPTSFSETLSWEYLSYVRTHPITWTIPTAILYGANDHLTSFDTMSAFAKSIHASLTIMENGEHWFHAKEQMVFLDGWIMHNYCG